MKPESSTNLKESTADPTSWFDFRRGPLGTETGNEVGDAAHDTCYIIRTMRPLWVATKVTTNVHLYTVEDLVFALLQ